LQYTDLILFDIKHIDNQGHKELTGQSNDNILEMAQYLSEVGQPVWIRHVLVPQRTDYDEFLIRLDAFIQTLNNVEKVEVLPYHTMGKFKWDKLGLEYPLEGIKPPEQDRIKNARELLHVDQYKGYLAH
ncbi:pyruvate formate lyase 1-activating protein, partial [Enterococcus cecorum]|nr:pyruvate formate lyase 1-activating protein [Enterococcus cecorum]